MTAPYYQDDAVTIYHGDCRDVLPTLTSTSVALVLTDPPYNISNRNGRDGTTVGQLKRADGTARKVWKDFGEWDRDWEPGPFLAETMRLLADGGSLVACTSEFLIADYLASGLNHRCLLFWRKANPTPAFRQVYVRTVEMAVWQVKGSTGWCFNGGGYEHQVWEGPAVANKQHPTQKPLGWMSHLVNMHSLSGGLVVDPHCGSGTTLRAAKDLGRRAVGIELDERYCEIAARRLSQGVLDFGA